MGDTAKQRESAELVTVSRGTAFKIGFFGALGVLTAAVMFFLIGLVVYAIFLLLAFHRQA
jgi:hypothetical protein